MTTQEEQIEILTQNLNALENESRRLLRAIRWSSKVRMILFAGLLLFVLISGFMFYRLYNEVKYNRIAEVQRIISEQPEEFAQPLTKQIMAMAETEGPYVADVFQAQIEKDSKLYFNAIEHEQTTLVNNLQSRLEARVIKSYAAMLDEQEGMLKKEFPELQDPEKLKNLRTNMETVYQKIGKRYYVDFMKDEMEDLTFKLEKFPPAKPRQPGTPISEQVATEFLELVRMMLVHSDHYVIPVEKAVSVNQPIRKTLAPESENPGEAEKSDSAAKSEVSDEGEKSDSAVESDEKEQD